MFLLWLNWRAFALGKQELLNIEMPVFGCSYVSAMRLPKKTQSPSLKYYAMKFNQLEQSPVCLDLVFPIIFII